MTLTTADHSDDGGDPVATAHERPVGAEPHEHDGDEDRQRPSDRRAEPGPLLARILC